MNKTNPGNIIVRYRKGTELPFERQFKNFQTNIRIILNEYPDLKEREALIGFSSTAVENVMAGKLPLSVTLAENVAKVANCIRG